MYELVSFFMGENPGFCAEASPMKKREAMPPPRCWQRVRLRSAGLRQKRLNAVSQRLQALCGQSTRRKR